MDTQNERNELNDTELIIFRVFPFIPFIPRIQFFITPFHSGYDDYSNAIPCFKAVL